jgi:zinc/manganese transport system substrate-binding protein
MSKVRLSQVFPSLLLVLCTTFSAQAGVTPDSSQGKATNPLKVIATVPTFGALLREIGGELLDVTVLCRCSQDLHSVSATPSLMARLAGADLLFYSGLDAELWLDQMMRGAGNLELAPGASSAIDMSAGIHLKEVPTSVSRREGDIHAYGNPHYWTDPIAVRQLAKHVSEVLSARLPDHADAIRARYATFNERFTKAIIRWLTEYKGLRGRQVVSYHRSWPYLLDRFGITRLDTVEPKPRVAPTASHLNQLIGSMKAQGVTVIIREPYQSPDAAQFVAEAAGATVIELTTHPGCPDGTDAIIDHFDHNLATLAAALGVQQETAR